MIGVEFGRDARRRLEAAGAAVSYRESPLPHAVDPDWLPELRDWVAAALAPPSA
ncbi:MAG: hypothetical protein M3N16_08610 [Actinomycetota bacterium]|nr:hypothetical protein [Actinomycetota bacterium]